MLRTLLGCGARIRVRTKLNMYHRALLCTLFGCGARIRVRTEHVSPYTALGVRTDLHHSSLLYRQLLQRRRVQRRRMQRWRLGGYSGGGCSKTLRQGAAIRHATWHCGMALRLNRKKRGQGGRSRRPARFGHWPCLNDKSRYNLLNGGT